MSDTTRTIAADALYWALLAHEQTGGSARVGSVPVRDMPVLDERFAETLPVPIESLKPVYITVDHHRVLAVAAPRKLLDTLTAPGTTVVGVGSLPAALSVDADLAQLMGQINFLWGDLEPRPVTAAKRRAALTAAAAIVLITAAALVGIERRAAAMRVDAAEHRSRTSAALNGLYPKLAESTAAQTALSQDLARLTRTRAGRPGVQRDATDALASLLSAWPRAVGKGEVVGKSGALPPKVLTESLTATPESLSLNVTLADRGDATVLSECLRTIAGWTLFQPQFTATTAPSGVSSSNGGTLSLRLAADAAAALPPAQAEGNP